MAAPSWSEARLLAILNYYSYYPDPPRSAYVLRDTGWQGQFMDLGFANFGGYAFARNDGRLFLVFAGSGNITTQDGLQDWMYNLEFKGVAGDKAGSGYVRDRLAVMPQGALIHSGFAFAASLVSDQVVAALVKYKPTSITLVGHSLGGAIACIQAWALKSTHPVDQVVTFGQPRWGNDIAAGALDAAFPGAWFRYHTAGDPVPLVPLSSGFGSYGHGGQAVPLPGPAGSAEDVGLIQSLVLSLSPLGLASVLYSAIDKGNSAHLLDSVIAGIETHIPGVTPFSEYPPLPPDAVPPPPPPSLPPGQAKPGPLVPATGGKPGAIGTAKPPGNGMGASSTVARDDVWR